MIDLFSVPVVAATSVTAYLGLYHFWLYLRRRSRSDLFFAITCACMSIYDVLAMLLYTNVPLGTAAFYQRLQFATICAMGMPFVLLINEQVNIRTNKWGYGILLVYPLCGLVGVIDPYNLLLTNTPSPKTLSTPWASSAFNEVQLGPLWQSFEVLLPIMLLYCLWAGWGGSTYKDGRLTLRHPQSIPLLLAAMTLLLSLFHDLLVATERIHTPYTLEYAWMGVSIVMGWTLSKEILDASQTRATLEDTERRVTTTLMAIQDAVITTDLGGNITHLNLAAEKLLAVTLKEAQDEPLEKYVEITSPETQSVVNDPVRFAVGRPANPYGRLPQLVTTDGNERHVDIGGAPLKNQQGHVDGAIVVMRDLTLQHNALDSLQHAKRMESMGQLAGGAAHDLNNLLTPIISYVDLVQRTMDVDSKPYLFLSHVQEAAQRAAGLTKQLLALSRKQVLDVQVIPLDEFVTQTLPMIERLVGEGIEVELALDNQAGNVRVDPAQFEQVLLNLAGNARDAMKGKGKLSIKTRHINDEEASFEIRDTGSGMSPDLVEHIFEPFFTTKERGKGTGLGLASVRGIVEQHGGTIFVDSEPGEGTSFEIILPTTHRDRPSPSSKAPPPSKITPGTEHVLVAEDDPAVRALIHDALTQLGYTVHTADGLTMAVALAESEKIDVLLSDVVLPGADGPQIRDAVCAIKEIPCLFMTGHADDRLGERGIVQQGTEVLRKPFTVAQLALRLRQVIDAPPRKPGASNS